MTATGTRLEWQRELADLTVKAEYKPENDDPAQADNEQRRARHIARYLAEHEGTLLLLDNVEHPELITSVLTDLAGTQIKCTLVYTARMQDMPTGFQAHAVDLLNEEGALRLLLGENRPTLLAETLTGDQDTEAQAARELVRKVEGLPLALILLRDLLRDHSTSVAELAEALNGPEVDDILEKLFIVLALSWEGLQSKEDENARRLFLLAGYFPEAAPIPLWLLGLAAGLGEANAVWKPLGKARTRLTRYSLVETLEDGAIRLHPLVREFARSEQVLPDAERQRLTRDACEQLAEELTIDLDKLEARARRLGYWGCLEQVQAALAYANLLGDDWSAPLVRMERWMDRESHVLGASGLWPEQVPGLFFQQFYTHSLEEGQPLPAAHVPERWVRQEAAVGAEDRTLLRVLVGHTEGVLSVAFSPDGKQVLTGSYDQTARLWDAKTGHALQVLAGHTNWVWSVAFSPDGKQVLTGSADRTARLWNAETGQVLRVLTGHTSRVRGVAFSPDGKQVLTGSDDQTARLWDAETGLVLRVLEGHTNEVKSVAFSPDGKQVLTGSLDRSARLWDAGTGQVLRLLGHNGSVMSVAFSRDGKRVLTGSGDQSARLWDTKSGQALRVLKGHTNEVTSVAFSHDGKRVLTGSTDKSARLWDTKSGKELRELLGHNGPVLSVAFSPDGKRMLTGSWDFLVWLWDAMTGKKLRMLAGHSDEVTSVAFSPDGKRVLTGSLDRTARLWDAETGQVLPRLRGVETGQVLRVLEGHADSVMSVAFSRDGKRLLTGSSDQTARLWDAESGKELWLLVGHTKMVTTVAFSPDGKRVLTGSWDGTARLWDAESGKELWLLVGHTNEVMKVVFSSDGKLIVTADYAGWVRVWQGTGVGQGTLLGVYKAAYSILAIHWVDHFRLLLADVGGPFHKPNIYRLTLEGM
jgi:WD40 repeat protein